jgi:histidine triad (HIT) family protein
MSTDCVFCKIIAGELKTYKVYEDGQTIVFLDAGPVFAGHCLISPKVHYQTMMDLPHDLLAPLFSTTQLICRAVEKGLQSGGSFVAVNNKISQTVPHLHIHVIPRTKGDGMKGFFWPRRPYRDDEHMLEIQQKLQAAIKELES